jgi:hypothetical protein
LSTHTQDDPVRAVEIDRIVASYGGPILYGRSAGGYESGLLLSEAVRCYSLRADIACILCAHACCERELAGILKWQRPFPPNAERWGLGRLIGTGRERRWFSSDLATKLDRVNENRRTLYHLQEFNAPTGLWQRAIRAGNNPATKDNVAEAIPGTLRRDALEGLECAFAVRTIEVEQDWTPTAGS